MHYGPREKLVLRALSENARATTTELAKVKRQGYKKATLRVHPDNKKAKEMYERRGFRVVRPEENPYGDEQPRLFMEKVLDQ